MSSHSFELSDPASGAPATPEGGEAAEGNGDDLQCSAYKNPRRTTPSPPSEAHTKVAGDAAFIPEDSILVFFPDDLNASGCALRCERKQQATRYQKESKVTFYGPLNEPPTVIRELEASAANAEAGEGLSCLPRQMENFLDCSNSCPHAESRAQHQIEQKALPDRVHSAMAASPATFRKTQSPRGSSSPPEASVATHAAPTDAHQASKAVHTTLTEAPTDESAADRQASSPTAAALSVAAIGGESACEKDLAVEVAKLRALVARLRAENEQLQQAALSHGRSCSANDSARCACSVVVGGKGSGGSEVQGIPSLHRPCASVASCPVGRKEGGTEASSEEASVRRRGAAPGAPPSGKGPPGRPPGGPPSRAEGAAGGGPLGPLGRSGAACLLWGLCPPEKPLSSLRRCCVDHLLLGGSCLAECIIGVDRRGWGEGFFRGVHCLGCRVGCCSLAVLEMREEGQEAYTVAQDPRLIGWFSRPQKSSGGTCLEAKTPGNGRIAAGGAIVKEHSKGSLPPQSKEAASLPPSLRKSISISLSALRRGCTDRRNFLKRLQSDILQCSLSTSAIELLLELVPAMHLASDRRQLWMDAREMLSRHRERSTRPLDDDEAFTSFVLEFGSLHQRLELLLFMNRKNLETHISLLLAQAQVKLDCLAMLRHRAGRLARCVQVAATAAAVVSGIRPPTPRHPPENAEAKAQDSAKENKAPTSAAAAHREETEGDFRQQTAAKSHTATEDPPKFRWPLLFEMVEKHCSFAADGSSDRSRSLLEVLAPHIGKPLDASELALLKRAAQKPLAALLEQQASLVRVLLLLHRAASLAASPGFRDAAGRKQEAAEEKNPRGNPVRAVAVRLLQCCRCSWDDDAPSCLEEREGELQQQQKKKSEGMASQEETADLLLSVIPKLLVSLKERLETLSRLVAQLLREYAAFVCWMGDSESFLPIEGLLPSKTDCKHPSPGGLQSPPLPSFLAAVILPSVQEVQQQAPSKLGPGKVPPKMDAFERLSAFLEKVSHHHTEPLAASCSSRKLLWERRCGSSGSRSGSPSSSSSSSLPLPSPGSSPESKKHPKMSRQKGFLAMKGQADPQPLRVQWQRESSALLPGNAGGLTPGNLRGLLLSRDVAASRQHWELEITAKRLRKVLRSQGAEEKQPAPSAACNFEGGANATIPWSTPLMAQRLNSNAQGGGATPALPLPLSGERSFPEAARKIHVPAEQESKQRSFSLASNPSEFCRGSFASVFCSASENAFGKEATALAACLPAAAALSMGGPPHARVLLHPPRMSLTMSPNMPLPSATCLSLCTSCSLCSSRSTPQISPRGRWRLWRAGSSSPFSTPRAVSASPCPKRGH
ncbi:uncharacterized protein LOC34623456 [Cyclospora cayetanensis]|uniref:Uncharacterized protein LOC34623456 n=1 Tax=Cyclospora cayetanensis TaxID=88456 RepID=A0A6P6RWB9_9EIME|nr:uncharacterized protein LOC34623456 [Cyclospora cayetanensis]